MMGHGLDVQEGRKLPGASRDSAAKGIFLRSRKSWHKKKQTTLFFWEVESRTDSAKRGCKRGGVRLRLVEGL